ncbi:protein-disulfide reductase DsbD family protein [Mucilaginibacter sp. KACC 22773]|uniref:protein-disulfide reductase DsbD domain-containing protein n=1 Tax=Mucilaginibacter sp. KACC 22773 TaxID=3025671 RepID=UPI002366EEE9|nr:protein-disulfide reductase DsbD domain-containing protein [Mucilaginibacter sp. KACC 22773]WDF77183.1 protein-disulfide reductase DsbD family protein [Mucilaginibacter sp. KACC 22773]
MKKIILLSLLLLGGIFTTKAQILQPVHWSYAAKKINATEAVLFFKANIDGGWHVYSQYLKEGGPVPTSFSFKPSKDYMLTGKTSEPKPVVRMEKVFDMEVGFFENEVIFQQKIKLKNKQTTVSGTISYMTCNDQKCLPPSDAEFSIAIK